jgi:hypothetical protein
MARNLFTYALMGGLAEGTDAYARGMAEEQRSARELEMRRQLMEDQQSNFMERRGLGAAGGAGGTGGARVPAQAMTAADAVANVNTIMQAPTEDEIRAMAPNAPEVMAPGYSESPVLDPRDAAARVTYGPDGKPLAAGEKPRMMLDPQFFAEKSKEVIRYRKLMFAGPNADELAKGEQTVVETNLLEGTAKGDRTAAEALLVNKGKDPRETAARADAQTAEADKDRRTDPNARRGGGGGAKAPAGPKPPSGVDIERTTRAAERAAALALGVTVQELNGEIARRSGAGARKPMTPEQQAAVSEYSAALARQRQMIPSKASAPAAAPAQSGPTKIGNSTVRPL